jgi:hypothetical protein
VSSLFSYTRSSCVCVCAVGVHLVMYTWGCAFLECLHDSFEPGMYADLIGEGVDGVTYTYASIRVLSSVCIRI